LRTSLTAAIFLTKYVAAVMEKRRGGGVIVNMSSVLAGRPGGISPAYNICKGGIETLTYESAVLYGPAGIRVVAISPGNVHTKLSGDYKDAGANDISGMLRRDMDDHTPLGRSGEPDEIARVVCWLASEEASFITGVCIPVDGGFLHNFNSYRMKKKQFHAEF
jgi:NAD(P)-dependent dehydrogenase (short-subunit alcohol dehydrogenase family)